MVGNAIKSLLTADSDVNALVSGRIYPLVAPQSGAEPYITYQIIDNRPNETDNRVSGLDFVEVQINCFDSHYDDQEGLSQKVRTALDQYVGVAASVDIREIRFEDERDLYDQDREKYGKAMDFEISVAR